jgi:hypothetical protein
VGITGIGFRLAPVSIAVSVHGEAGNVEDSLVSLPQQCYQERRATSAGLSTAQTISLANESEIRL